MCKWCRLTAAGENSWIYRIWDVYYPYLWVRPKILLWCLVFFFVVVIISIEYFYLYFSSPLYNQKAKSKSIEIWVNLIHLNGYYILWMINWLRGGSFFFVGGLVENFFFYGSQLDKFCIYCYLVYVVFIYFYSRILYRLIWNCWAGTDSIFYMFL